MIIVTFGGEAADDENWPPVLYKGKLTKEVAEAIANKHNCYDGKPALKKVKGGWFVSFANNRFVTPLKTTGEDGEGFEYDPDAQEGVGLLTMTIYDIKPTMLISSRGE